MSVFDYAARREKEANQDQKELDRVEKDRRQELDIPRSGKINDERIEPGRMVVGDRMTTDSLHKEEERVMKSTPKFCRECGKPVASLSLFCAQCGAKI
jgi:hypothetical protein